MVMGMYAAHVFHLVLFRNGLCQDTVSHPQSLPFSILLSNSTATSMDTCHLSDFPIWKPQEEIGEGKGKLWYFFL